MQLDVADPLQRAKTVEVLLVNKQLRVNQSLEVSLPQGEYAGSTVSNQIAIGKK
jgi:chondroitin AC lyase